MKNRSTCKSSQIKRVCLSIIDAHLNAVFPQIFWHFTKERHFHGCFYQQWSWCWRDYNFLKNVSWKRFKKWFLGKIWKTFLYWTLKLCWCHQSFFLLQSSSLITLICFLTIYHSCERQFQTKDIFYLLSCWRKLKRHNIFWLRSSLIRILLSVTSGHTMPEQIIVVCGTEIEVNILTFVSIFVLVCLPASKPAIVTAAHEKQL